MKDRAFLGASVAAAIVASLCCILPIVFAVAGFSIIRASAFFAAWRPYLLAATFALLALGFYFAYRPPRQECEPGTVCARPGTGRTVRVMLWIAAFAVFAFAAFPYYSGRMAELIPGGDSGGPVAAQSTPKVERVVAMAKEATAKFKVTGMTCGACVASVKKALSKTKGVKSAEVSLEKELATVVYDDRQVNQQQLREAVNKTGFKAEPAEEKK